MAVNKISTLLIMGALLSGVGAAYFTDHYISRRVQEEKDRITEQYKPSKVVVAKRNLRVGDVLDYDNLAIREMPSGFIHASAISSEFADTVVGKRIMQSLNAGESLLTNFLASRTGSGFSNLIEPGKRALTFPVDIVSSMSGLLRPGDKIDIMVTLRKGKSVTRPLLKNVTILATGAIIDDEGRITESGAYQTVTISVTPVNAAKITHAREVGNMTVVLRSGKNENNQLTNKELTTPITVQNLFGDAQPKSIDIPRVEIIVGG